MLVQLLLNFYAFLPVTLEECRTNRKFSNRPQGGEMLTWRSCMKFASLMSVKLVSQLNALRTAGDILSEKIY